LPSESTAIKSLKFLVARRRDKKSRYLPLPFRYFTKLDAENQRSRRDFF
jgi:hypothetical protein